MLVDDPVHRYLDSSQPTPPSLFPHKRAPRISERLTTPALPNPQPKASPPPQPLCSRRNHPASAATLFVFSPFSRRPHQRNIDVGAPSTKNMLACNEKRRSIGYTKAVLPLEPLGSGMGAR